MYEWFWGIFAKKTKFHDAGGPGTVVLPNLEESFRVDLVLGEIKTRTNKESANYSLLFSRFSSL